MQYDLCLKFILHNRLLLKHEIVYPNDIVDLISTWKIEQ